MLMKNFTRFFVFALAICFLSIDLTFGQLPGQIPLNPKLIPQFVDPLPHFAGNRVNASLGTNNLTIAYEPLTHIAVSTGTVLATGTVGPFFPDAGKARYWGYSVSNGIVSTPPYWPAFTIEARRGTPVNVTYVNNLAGETYASVNLKADQTLHWANPLGDMTMPMTEYTGDVPVSPHLHGGEVPSESDGGPDSWFTPGYALMGPSWLQGVDQYYNYPNTQEAATLWWHDHALGVTRLNVYAGLAGFYFLRGADEETDQLPGWSGDDLVQEVAPVGKSGTFSTQPYLPEIEVVFQDRMFDNTGALYFPNLPTNPTVHPFWTPEFIGDIITVNGKTWPYFSVAPRKYRFRLLNGSNARFYEMWLQDLVSGAIGPQIVQIGTDGGLLDAPVPIVGRLLLAPGERADVIIDFTASTPGQVWTLKNSANTPFPKGGPPNGSTVGRLMQFVVNGTMVSSTNPAMPGIDKSKLPLALRTTPLVRLTNFAGVTNTIPDLKRQLTLNEVMGMGGPLEVLVNNSKWDMNGMMTEGLGETELPVEGTTELWQIINLTADAHPIHLHLVQFQLVSRQKFNLNKYNAAYNASFPGGTVDGVTYLPGVFMPAYGPPLNYQTPLNLDAAVGGNPAITQFLQGPIKPALLNEMGWKDTYVVYPGEVTTFAIRYMPTDVKLGTPGQFSFDPSQGPGYVWHCHIIDHEDNEMMRPYKVIRPVASASALAGSFIGAKGATALGTANAMGASTQQSTNLMSETVNDFTLDQNFPNPVTNETEIRFNLPEAAHVRLTLFNSMGQTVKVLIDANAPQGENIVRFNAESLKNGIYYYRLNSGIFSKVRTMVVNN